MIPADVKGDLKEETELFKRSTLKTWRHATDMLFSFDRRNILKKPGEVDSEEFEKH